MKKILLSLLTVSTISLSLFAGCGNPSSTGHSAKGEAVKVGMVTDSGTIDDKSFNQGTWDGMKKAEEEFGVKIQYLQPGGVTESDYTKEIANLYDAGYRLIITPGYKFETAVFASQDKYPDANFLLVDGEPNNGKTGDENILKVGDNTACVYFAEEQAGFIVGVVASVQLKEGDLGFIGGMEIPSVQKFNWGFQQGIDYANQNLGTNMSLKEENVLYQGSFDDSAAGTQIAAQMYDRGVKAIFCAAGAVGNGVITEAKTRVNSNNEAWVIGVDSDQYDDGIYAEGKSVILTSAIKKIDSTAYEMIKEYVNGSYPGGTVITFDITNDGVGIPAENPNLTEETVKTVDEVITKMKDGSIKVSKEQGNLIK